MRMTLRTLSHRHPGGDADHPIGRRPGGDADSLDHADLRRCRRDAVRRHMAGMDHGGTHDAMPAMDHGGHGMAAPEFDLAYIDMMLPHHESIIALAEVALPELTDPRLVAMAENIIATQTAENEQMTQLRESWYPDAAEVTMAEMMAAMPSMGTDMAHMDEQMSAEWQVQTFCAADNKDLAFIEQAIPHHQMAIDVSEDALAQAVHPELKASRRRRDRAEGGRGSPSWRRSRRAHRRGDPGELTAITAARAR